MNVNYNFAFSFSPNTFLTLIELADSNKYTLNGLAEHASNLSGSDISAIENTIAFLIDSGI